MTPAPAGSLDAILGEMEVRLLALDFREAPRTGPGALVRQTRAVRQIGSVYDTRIPGEFLSSIDSAGAYDVLLFVESTATARPIRETKPRQYSAGSTAPSVTTPSHGYRGRVFASCECCLLSRLAIGSVPPVG